jgi:hypothetical protein
MAQRQEVKLSNGSIVWVELAKPLVAEREVAQKADPQAFQAVVPGLIALCTDLNTALTTVAPTKASVEFGLSLTVETSGLALLVAKGGAEATFKISLEWEGKETSTTR